MPRLPAFWLLPALCVFIVAELVLLAWVDPASRSALIVTRLAMAGVLVLLLGVLAAVRWWLNRALAGKQGLRTGLPMPLLPSAWPAAAIAVLALADLDAWFRVLPDERSMLAVIRAVSLAAALAAVVALGALDRRRQRRP